MIKYLNFREFNLFFVELFQDGSVIFNNDDNSILISFTIDGGYFEFCSLNVKFKNIHFFSLCVMIDPRIILVDSLLNVPSNNFSSDITNYAKNYRLQPKCFKFFYKEQPTDYYVICDDISLWLDSNISFEQLPIDHPIFFMLDKYKHF